MFCTSRYFLTSAESERPGARVLRILHETDVLCPYLVLKHIFPLRHIPTVPPWVPIELPVHSVDTTSQYMEQDTTIFDITSTHRKHIILDSLDMNK